MASPQKENGYTPIANELMEKLSALSINATSFRVIICILRKTYGWQKREDIISLSQIKKMTGLDRSVVNAIKELEELNILKITRREGLTNVIRFNKDYEKWGLVQSTAQAELVQNRAGTSAKSCQELVQPIAHTKETLQKKIQKKGDIVINTVEKHLVEKESIIQDMYNYVKTDDNGNPIKSKVSRITKDENNMLISVGFLWQEMCSKKLDISKNEVPMNKIYYAIRKCYDRDKFSREDYKELFKYFLNDKIPEEMKLSFDLCLSEKYVAKYKLSKKIKSKIFNNASVAENIEL
jgi:phage replication O-like protein O